MNFLENRLDDILKSAICTNIAEFPEHIESMLDKELKGAPNRRKICICSTGASLTAGDIMSDFADGSSDSPIPVIRNSDLPKWIGPDTLVIAMSYSGETGETLDQYDRAKERGCSVLCITSGGKLLERCRDNGDHCMELPQGIEPRASLGYMLGGLASVLEDLGICGSRTALKGMLEELKGFRNKILDDLAPSSLADSLENRIPVIYGMPNVRSSSMGMRSQINVHSGNIAFSGTIPEFNHNEIVAWSDDPSTEGFCPVILYDDGASEVMRIITDAVVGTLNDNGQYLKVFHVNGSNNLEKNLKCILLGELTSLFLESRRSSAA